MAFLRFSILEKQMVFGMQGRIFLEEDTMMKKRIAAVLLALVMALALLPVTAFADEKTLEVDGDLTTNAEGVSYTTIQAAIDYIAGLSTATEKTGWTINVENGNYARFTVPAGLTDLTIKGESEEDVIVSVLDDTYTEKTNDDNGGINVFAKNVTLKNMTINAGTSKLYWCDAAISTNNLNTGGAGFSLTVDQCTVKKEAGINSGALYGIFWACPEMNVTNCTISGFANAIEITGDNFKIPAWKTCSFTNNKITGASFAIHGYMGGGKDANEKVGGGKLLIANNEVIGTDDLRSKIVCMDNDKALDSFIVEIKDNTLTNVLVGLVNLQNEGDVVCDVLENNNFGVNCFYVEAVEPGTIEFYTTYKAPSGQKGRWMLKDADGWEDLNEGIDISVVKNAIEAANAAGSRELTIIGVEEDTLIKTFTYMKDIIYWVTDTEEVPPADETPSHEHTRRQPTTVTETTPQTEDVTSAKTFDAGIAVYAAMAVLSMTGSAWIVGKRH